MSLAKPAIADMRFAVDTLNADAANITAPSSGQRDTGWNLNQVPPSSFFNYFHNRTYRWMLFLDEVFKTAGVAVADIKLTGAANITGVVTAGSGLVVSAGGAAVTGNSSVVGTLSVSALATLASATITGNAAVGGTLGVTGAVTIGGSLTASGGTLAVTGNETVSGTLGVTGASTLTGAVTTGTDVAAAGNVTAGGQLMAFTDFTFTATGGSANLVATAHPLHTGTGPIRGSNSGGALPSGFPSATDVFAIKVDANTFQIASTLANALAGIPITMSTAGTGTQTINHQPTTTRIADVTATRNLVVGNKASAAAYVLSAPQGIFYCGSDFVLDGGSPTRVGEVWTFASASTQVVTCSLRLLPGTVISDLVWSYNRTTSTLALELLRRSFGDGGATSGTVSTTTVGSGTGATSVSASASGTGMPHTVADGFLYFLRVTSSSVATFDGVKLLIDRR